MQPSIRAFLNGERDEAPPPKFVDLFCGCGGASQGAVEAGAEVVLAVDSCPEALEVYRDNHPGVTQLCLCLPPTGPLPLPESGRWHLHGSPPCTKVSRGNQQRGEQDREDAISMVKWYIEFAATSSAASWSMEQVATPIVMDCLCEYQLPGSPFRNSVDFDVFHFEKLGVPQNRRRLIAGSPDLVARLRRIPAWRRGVSDVIAVPRGTHVRNWMYRSCPVPDRSGTSKYIYRSFSEDEACKPVAGPAPCVLSANGLRWATPGSGKRLFALSPAENAALQCFPSRYIFSCSATRARFFIGNAVPPIIMCQALTGKRPRPRLLDAAPSRAEPRAEQGSARVHRAPPPQHVQHHPDA